MPVTERLERRAPVRANSYDPETRSFDAVISTGAPVERRDFEGPFLEVLNLDQDWPVSVPLLDTHRSWGVDNILGKASGFRVERGELIARIRLSTRSEVAALARDIQDGIVDSLSIGYTVERWRDETSNGVRQKTAAKWRLHEASLVPIPADAGAKVRGETMPEEIGEQERHTRPASRRALESLADEAGLGEGFVDECVDGKLTERQARALAFEQLKARSNAAKVSNTRHNDATLDNPVARRNVMAEAYAARMLGATPSESASAFMQDGFRTLSDAARDCLERAGERVIGLTPLQLVERAYNTTSDFSMLLTEVGNRTLAARFQLLLSPIVRLARRKTAQDFRAFSELRLGTNMRLEPLGEAGEFKAGNFTESKESMRVASYGKTFALSFHAIANDDLGAFNQVTSDLATAASLTANDLVLGLIKANPNLGSDNKAVFHADHDNLLTSGSALADTSIKTAVLSMRRQTGIAGERITVNPSILAVAPELEETARKLLAAITATETANVNPWSGAFQLVVEPGFDDAAAWYLIDPALGDLVDAYLSGYEGAQVETRPGWNTLGTEWRVHMHYGTAFMGYRGWLKATGAA